MDHTATKKSTPMRLLERLHPGKSIGEIVREACARHDTPEGAAHELGVSVVTLRAWKQRFCGDEQSAEVTA